MTKPPTPTAAASTTPSETTIALSRCGSAPRKRHGGHTANTAPAVAIRSHATPDGASCANSSTAKDGPR